MSGIEVAEIVDGAGRTIGFAPVGQSADVTFEPVEVVGHLVINGERQTELTTIPAGQEAEATGPKQWEGPLGLEGSPTSDKRYLIPGEITHRDLPLPLRYQPADVGGHDGAVQVGSIDSLQRIPIAKFDRAEEFGLTDVRDGAIVIWGSGELDGSPAAQEAERYIENGAGVSLDVGHDRLALLDPKTFEEIPEDEVDLAAALAGEYVTGIAGRIQAATIVDISAFEEATVKIADGAALVASAMPLRLKLDLTTLTAAAAPLKPKAAWMQNPNLKRLTPMTYTDEGRVFGHLCDWSGCHTGFSHICVPPFRSQTDFAYFNVGTIETDDGQIVPCGKLMFSMDGVGHADATPGVDWQKAAQHYDNATKVGAFVRAGSDRFGIWLAGVLRPGLTEEEVQHLRAHPPSGDWRPIPGKGSELVAAFAVAVPGFPIPHALVASAAGGELTVITAPLEIEAMGPREIRRRMEVLKSRREALAEFGREQQWALEPESEEFATITAEQRRQWAKSGVAMRDGSFPVTKCTGPGTSAESARRAIGRAPASKRASVERHIRRRESALGCATD